MDLVPESATVGYLGPLGEQAYLKARDIEKPRTTPSTWRG